MALSFLVADGDERFRSRLCAALRVYGYVVHEAKDGAQALAMLHTAQPDIVLTEMLMPGADGFEVIAAVKAGPSAAVVIAMSAHPRLAGLDLLRLAARLGADATLARPFDVERLMGAVKSALAAQSSQVA